MSEQAEHLASQFVSDHQELLALAERCSPEDWRLVCSEEGWPVGVVVHHVAVGYAETVIWLEAIAAGRDVPMDWDERNRLNAEHAAVEAVYSQEETLDLLRSNADRTASIIGGLTEEQLDRSGVIDLLGDEPITAERLIDNIVLGHLRYMHLPSVKATLAGAATRQAHGELPT